MWCPRCNQGEVVKARIILTGEIVNVCQECEALWPDQVEIQQEGFTDFSNYVKPKGLKGLWSELQQERTNPFSIRQREILQTVRNKSPAKATTLQLTTPMKYQLVLQWPASTLADYDRMIVVENSLIGNLGRKHEVDGHDQGAGQMNIFIRTDAPKDVYRMARPILEDHDAWENVRVAYREISGTTYTILWPVGLTEFSVT